MSWGVYVHVPWCRIRCPYCAFAIVPEQGQPPEQTFLDGLGTDLERWRPQFPAPPPTTLYIGGGTPSRLSASTLASIVDSIGATSEVTIEANPEDLSQVWLDGVVEAGATRISLGVQTFVPALQRRVGRAHHDPIPALDRLAASGISWSADLIFALPGQTLADLDHDLDQLLSYHPPHVSLYDLTLEPGTGLTRLHKRRPLPLPDEQLWSTLQDRLLTRLQRDGLERYEISNFARPGHRSLHNQLYWTQRPYLALGPAAHGFAPDGRRWTNPLWSVWPGEPEIENPTPRQAAVDALISGLRTTAGLGRRHVPGLKQGLLTELAEHGLLRTTPTHLVLTTRGLDLHDRIVARLADSLDPEGP